MGNWQRWLKAPATLWFRRALFQVHLWLGIGLGLYVLMISVSGSAIVLRPQMSRWFVPSEVVPGPTALKDAALEARVAEIYADYAVKMVVASTNEARATYVVLDKDGTESSRFFDQYRGVDLGSSFPWQVAATEWLVDLHDDLLMDRKGRRLNGWGGVLFMGMIVTGLVLWWQGSRRWKEGLVIRRRSPRSFNWQLHSFLGLWALPLMLAWGITAMYFAWPAPFDWLIDSFDADINDFDRPDGWLRFLIDLHFGRFRGLLWANVLWIFLGLIPAVLYITGFIVWYKRVVRRLPPQ
ncbi:MAG TPA: PepSY-associated TM helix domain-containing protein [Hyphomicrobiales bacterium]|nr:PepSY-associated TM helix domain-containing protein [Hyphomicrobiales bacterium]